MAQNRCQQNDLQLHCFTFYIIYFISHDFTVLRIIYNELSILIISELINNNLIIITVALFKGLSG